MVHADIKFSGPQGRTGRVEVNGEDISGGVTALQVNAAAKGGVELVLTLRLGRLAAELGDAVVTVDEQTHKFLTALGWTPPDRCATKGVIHHVDPGSVLSSPLPPWLGKTDSSSRSV